MNITVTKNQVSVNTDYILNDKEYNVNQCYFTFSDEYTDDLVKKAIFVQGTSTIEMSIINNQCQIPAEVLNNGQFELRVYAYEVDGDELVLRYSPSYTTAYVRTGSYIENAESPEVITPTQFEQYMQAMNDGLNEVANVDIDAEQLDNGMSVTITNRYGEDKTVYAYDGEKGEIGATPNIQIGTVVTGDHSEVTRTGTNENPILNFILEKGETGATGNGIATVTKTATSGLVDTYTITYTNGNTTTFNVTNGKGITDISKTSTSGLIDTYTITYSDNTTSTFTVENGNGIANIEKTSTVDNVDTYTITYTNGTTSTFTVTNSTVTDEEFEDLQEEVNKYKTLANILPRVSGTGTDLSLNNTGEGTPLEIDLEGQTSQESTSGKQLFDLTKITSSSSFGITATINENTGEIILNGTSTSTAYLRFDLDNSIPSGTIVSYGANNSLTKNNCYLNLALDGATKQVLQMNTLNAKNENITLNTDINRVYIQVNSGITLNNFVIKPMLNVGNVLEQYEPYTGGIPAPNPDYPYPIKKVTGENNTKIENKNLFDIISFENQLVTGKILNDNGVEVNDNSSTYSKYMIYLKANTTYHIKGAFQRIYYYDENGIFKSRSSASNGVNSSYTPTANEYIGFQINNTYWASNKGQEQIEFGGVATSYVEHEEQNYPLTLGDLEIYEDGYFFKNETSNPNYDSNLDENAWYLKNYYGKVVLDGSESWQNWNLVTTEPLVGFILDGYVDYDNSSGTDVRGLSNYFKVFANAMPTQQSIGLRQTGDSIKRIYLAISNEIVSNLTEFKSWLSNHNTELVYLSATPSFTKIPSLTLIDELENIKNNAKSYKDVTNISQINDELPFIITASGFYDLNNLISRVATLETEV